ncbi:hypothetical protein NCC49_000866 [Naganishia albida]|nr:hypothetical protein NCC49_000866 [Naganishia albida]
MDTFCLLSNGHPLVDSPTTFHEVSAVSVILCEVHTVIDVTPSYRRLMIFRPVKASIVFHIATTTPAVHIRTSEKGRSPGIRSNGLSPQAKITADVDAGRWVVPDFGRLGRIGTECDVPGAERYTWTALGIMKICGTKCTQNGAGEISLAGIGSHGRC